MYFKIALSNMAQDKAISLAVKGDYLAPYKHPHPIIKILLKYRLRNVIIIIQRESTHSIGGCSEFRLIFVLTDNAYPVGQTG